MPYNIFRENEIPACCGEKIHSGGNIMAKKHTLLKLLTGAALAGGLVYLAKKNNENAAEPAVDTEGIPEAEPEEGAWRIKIDGEEMSAEEIKERFKEEATKAFGTFKEDAKVVSEEILVGLKKAVEEVKAAVEEAKKAAAERRAAGAEEAKEACEDAEKAAECCCKKAAEKAEEIRECCCEKAEELKEVVEDVIEEVKEDIEQIKEDVEG
jgi:hypothetical protein